MVFSGGQAVKCKTANINVLGATLNWKRDFASDITLYSGALLPGDSVLYQDGTFANEPIGYKYTATTASTAALISFNYKTLVH
ncbi:MULTISPECIES: hypothetical protein [Sphingobacterium]|uniref:hypothetical protein n=1 Tax=Sphingobacterium TaxID=28453 RepID=UPI0013DB1AC9|nr:MULTISPECIES: hypothetical protein [unclassified Sphingobacterium]